MALALASRSRSTNAALGSRVARPRRALAPPGIRARAEGSAVVSGLALEARRPRPAIQTKLEIGAPNDRFEQEAELVGEQVMRMPASATGAVARLFTFAATRSPIRMDVRLRREPKPWPWHSRPELRACSRHRAPHGGGLPAHRVGQVKGPNRGPGYRARPSEGDRPRRASRPSSRSAHRTTASSRKRSGSPSRSCALRP